MTAALFQESLGGLAVLIMNSLGLGIFAIVTVGPVPPSLWLIIYSFPAASLRGGSSGSRERRPSCGFLAWPGGQPPKYPQCAGMTQAPEEVKESEKRGCDSCQLDHTPFSFFHISFFDYSRTSEVTLSVTSRNFSLCVLVTLRPSHFWH